MDAAGDGARCDGKRAAARRGMGAPPRGGLGQANGAVSRNERSKELEISADCHSIDGVDREESVDGSVEPITVLERARSETSNFFKIQNVCNITVTNIASSQPIKTGPILSSM